MGTEIPVGALIDVLRGTAFALFFIIAFLMMVIILLQEGKGGGLAGAFGGAGAETFGVKAGTVNKLTAWIATAFLGLALIHAGLVSASTIRNPEDSNVPLPAEIEDAAGGEDAAADAGDADAGSEGGGGEEKDAPDGN